MRRHWAVGAGLLLAAMAASPAVIHGGAQQPSGLAATEPDSKSEECSPVHDAASEPSIAATAALLPVGEFEVYRKALPDGRAVTVTKTLVDLKYHVPTSEEQDRAHKMSGLAVASKVAQWDYVARIGEASGNGVAIWRREDGLMEWIERERPYFRTTVLDVAVRGDRAAIVYSAFGDVSVDVTERQTDGRYSLLMSDRIFKGTELALMERASLVWLTDPYALLLVDGDTPDEEFWLIRPEGAEMVYRRKNVPRPVPRLETEACGDGPTCLYLSGIHPAGVAGYEVVADRFRAKARKLLRQDCARGNTGACCSLAYAWPERSQAAAFFREACDAGDASSCYALGVMSENKGDRAEAARLYQTGCDGGCAMACLTLAAMHEAGWGVDRDDAKAAALRARACTAGIQAACGQAVP